jgi:O-antigen/teichoic acid export membrane protein
MTRAKATARGYLWNHAGKVLEYFLLFITTIVVARGLGVAENGVYAALASFAQLLVVLSSLSLESSLSRFVPQLEAADPQRRDLHLRFMLRRIFLVRGATLAGVVLLGSVLVHVSGIEVPDLLRRYFWLLSGYAVIRSFVQLVSMVFVAQLRTAPLAGTAVAVRAIELAGITTMAATGMTVSSVMLFLISTGFLQIAICLYMGRSVFSGESAPYPLRPVLVFGAVFWTNSILEYFLGRQGDVLFLSTLLPSAVPASQYNVAFTLVLASTQVLTLGFGGITLTSFSHLAATSLQTMDRFYAFLVRVVSTLVMPALVFIFFNARPIITLLFSPEFADAAILVQWMILFRIIARLFAGSENAEYMLARGKTFSVVQIGIIGATLNIALDLILIPRFLALGAVVGSGCANIAVNLLGSFYVRRLAGHRVIQGTYWAIISVVAFSAGLLVSYLLPGGDIFLLLGRGVAFSALVLLFLYLAKPFSEPDVSWVKEISEPVARVFSRFSRRPVETIVQVS